MMTEFNPYQSPKSSDRMNHPQAPPVFMELDGKAYSRANSLRPYTCKQLRPHLVAAVCFGSAGALSVLTPNATFTSNVFAIIFFSFAGLSSLIMLLNQLRVSQVSSMSYEQIRSKLQKSEKQYRYKAAELELKGLQIGAVLFSTILVLLWVQRLIHAI